MTILPHAASRQRPSADLLAQKLAPCNLNQIFFPGYAVVASDRTRESLTLKLEATEPAICPKCGEPCTKIHDTRPRLIRDAPFPGVTVVWLLVPIRRVRCKCRCRRTETIPWIAHHEQCTNRFIALIQNQMRGVDASATAVAAKHNLGWDAVRRFDKEQLEALFNDVNTQDLKIIAVDEIAIHKGQKYATVFINYETRQVFAVVKGKTQKAVESVFQMLVDRGLQDQIIAVACDMNAAYPNVVKKFLPKAEIVFDQFHVIQHLSAEVFKEARQVQAEEVEAEFGKKSDQAKAARKILRTAAWDLVMPEHSLTPTIRERLEEIRKANNLMSTMLPLADMVRCIWHAWSQENAAEMLAECIEAFEALAQDHDLKKTAKFARMLNNHSFGILTAWKHRISTGPLEGVNTRAKLIKRIGYGYKSFEYFALKLKAAFPGRGRNPLMLLGEWTAVIKSRLCHTDLGMEREGPLFFNYSAA